MTKSEYADYLNSEHWQQTRAERLGTMAVSCEKCRISRWLAEIAYDQDLHLHHRHYRTLGAEQGDDLQILCRRCHEIETFGQSSLKDYSPSSCPCCDQPTNNKYGLCDPCEMLLGVSSIYSTHICLGAHRADVDYLEVFRMLLTSCYLFIKNNDLAEDVLTVWNRALPRAFGKLKIKIKRAA